MTPAERATNALLELLDELAGIVHQPDDPELDDYVGAFINVAYGDGIARPNVWVN